MVISPYNVHFISFIDQGSYMNVGKTHIRLTRKIYNVSITTS